MTKEQALEKARPVLGINLCNAYPGLDHRIAAELMRAYAAGVASMLFVGFPHNEATAREQHILVEADKLERG